MAFNKTIWKQLYALAQKYAEAKPWEKIHANLFVEVDLPDGQKGYCTVLGHIEELKGLVVYAGDAGMQSILRMVNGHTIGRDEFQTGRTQECIGFFLGDRDEVGKEQYAIIRELGLKFRGHGKWMYFETYRKYYYPFCPTDDEAGIMAAAMEGFLAALGHIPEKELSSIHQEPRILYYNPKKGKMDPARGIPKDYPVDEIGHPDPAREFALKKAARRKSGQLLELGVFYMREGVLDEEKHPYHARISLLAIHEGEMCRFNLLTPDICSGQDMIDLLSDWIESNGLPEEVYVPDVVIMERIRPLTSFLKIKVSVHPLPSIMEFLAGIGESGASEDYPDDSDELLEEILSAFGMDMDEAKRLASSMGPEEFTGYMLEKMRMDMLDDEGWDGEEWEADYWNDDPDVLWSEPQKMSEKRRAVREFFSNKEGFAPDELYIQFDWTEIPQKGLLLCSTKKELTDLARESKLVLKTSLSKERIVEALMDQLKQAQTKKADSVPGLPSKGSGTWKLVQYIQKEMKSWDKDPDDYEFPEEAFDEFKFSQDEVLDAVRWGLVDVDLGTDDDGCCILRLAVVRDAYK